MLIIGHVRKQMKMTIEARKLNPTKVEKYTKVTPKL